MSQIKLGCCGFPKAKGKYFQQFELVEIQQAFYKLPSVRFKELMRSKE